MSDQIAAGPELDALIAERVFGWTYDEKLEIWSTPRINGVRGQGMMPPPYSTDIAAAWTVVERCTAIGPFGYRDVNGLPIATWFMAHFEKAGLWAHSAPEAAERICQIALLAIEGRPVQ